MPGLSVDKFIEIYAIMPSARQFGYKRGNLSRLNSVGWLPETIFALRRANLPHTILQEAQKSFPLRDAL
jgi:hypothetical protein